MTHPRGTESPAHHPAGHGSWHDARMFETRTLSPSRPAARRLALAAATLGALTLSLSACGSSGGSESAAGAPAVFELRPVTKVETTLTCDLGRPPNQPTKPITVCAGPTEKVTLGPATVDDSDVEKTEVKNSKAAVDGKPVVFVTLDPAGKAALAKETAALAKKAPPNNQIAILKDGTIIAMPALANGTNTAVIELGGNANVAAATELAKRIKS
jgi:hypothetical protein